MSDDKIGVLLVKMSSLGDLVHSFPAISDARAVLGDQLELDWLVDAQYAEVPSWHRAVARVVPVALRRWKRQPGLRAAGELMSYLFSLRARRYAAVIDAQGLLKSSLLGALPARGASHGYAAGFAREGAASVFYRTTHPIAREQHAIERTRQLFAVSLGYAKPEGGPDYGVEPLARPKGEGAGRLVLITASARAAKRWDDAKWVALARLATKAGYEVELTWGTAAERGQAKQLAAAAKARLAPKLELADLPAYLAGAAAVVSLDTGLAHVAAAWATPNVCLCTATDPKLSGALGKNQLALGSAHELGASEVWDRLQELLDPKANKATTRHKARAA